jgi:hypothetical protein
MSPLLIRVGTVSETLPEGVRQVYVFGGFARHLRHMLEYMLTQRHIIFFVFSTLGRNSSVGIATHYELDDPGIESRWGRDFSHLSGPALGVKPASCKIGTAYLSQGSSSRGVGLTTQPISRRG